MERYLTDSENQFVIDLNPPPPVVLPAAVVLFEDQFYRAQTAWTAVQPPGNYLDGPMRWQYDPFSQAFSEQSNIYTDAAAASPSGVAPMLINETVVPAAFSYHARLVAGAGAHRQPRVARVTRVEP